MVDHIVFDVEVQNVPGEHGITWDDTDKLLVSCACVWQYQDQRMRIYGPDDVKALQERLLQADRISGFNIFNFDLALIWGYAKQEWALRGRDSGPARDIDNLRNMLLPKTNDVLRRIWQEGLHLDPDVFVLETHGSWGLDRVSKATLNAPGKIGHGAEAPKWFQAGQWARVASYCADDVALERDLVDFVDRYGYVSNGNQTVQLAKWGDT